jgi:hypothetical protein
MPHSKNDAWNRLYHTYSLNREDFQRHYHKRSNVESTFHMVKPYGQVEVWRGAAKKNLHGSG